MPERDDQRLGDGGVLDLVGVGGGAEPEQVEAGDLAELGELLGDAGQLEPGREHARRLRALPGREYGDHITTMAPSRPLAASTTHTAFPRIL